MTVTKLTSTAKTFTFIGGLVGLVLFLIVGLLPAVVYGGYAGIILAGALFGAPLPATIVCKLIIIFGITIGLLSTASLFVVLGAVIGTGINGLLDQVVTPMFAKVKA